MLRVCGLEAGGDLFLELLAVFAGLLPGSPLLLFQVPG